ncbi:15639_t:CDS:2 [Acaulospora colombiana]|uniref:15639_t:CDS:1 n=1 Tax=Acaulospora colombiana TaxID=27376 RepID=A0ACA9LQ00_9GLOM|nr:15639_t:CDS:2 [Acaulospora colombiana]
MLQQSPLQHENLQTNTIPLEATPTSNTQTPLHPQTRDPNSHAITTSPQLTAQRSPFVMASPAGAATAASETVATPLRFNMKAPPSENQDTLTQVTLPIQHSTSKYFHPAQPTSALISALLTPERAEELLSTLTIEQLSLIEKSVQRVKRKKNKESKRLSINGNSNANDLNADLNNSDLLDTPKSNASKTPILISNSPPLPVSLGNTISSFVTSPNANETISRQSANDINNPAPNHALPATDPVIVVHEGVQWVVFTYSVKGNNKEYRIRIDIDKINLDTIDEKFRRDNCLYPRANCTEDKYKGNRWSYEKECNELGWKLAWLNREEIGGRRGLLQRAVDSYRNRDPSLRSRRVARNEKIQNGTLRKRVTRDADDGSAESSAKRPRGAGRQLTIESTVKGEVIKIRIRADIECVNVSEIPDEYKKNNCIHPKAVVEKANYQGSNWELESSSNELGWKLAFHNRPKLDGKRTLLQKAIEIYREKYNRAIRPRRGRYSHTLSAKFFENHPCEVGSGHDHASSSSSLSENKSMTPDNFALNSPTLSNPEPGTVLGDT